MMHLVGVCRPPFKKQGGLFFELLSGFFGAQFPYFSICF